MLTSISLFKPSRSHSWYIQYTDTDGRRRQKSTGKCIKRDALKVLTEFEKLLQSTNSTNASIEAGRAIS